MSHGIIRGISREYPPILRCSLGRQAYTLYRMSLHFGAENPELTKAIKRIAATNTAGIGFIEHALDAMDDDGFDHSDVLMCLRKGKAFGPEIQNGELRANVIHRGYRIRVVVGGLNDVNGDWALLQELVVVTVMEAK